MGAGIDHWKGRYWREREERERERGGGGGEVAREWEREEGSEENRCLQMEK